ncbi:hypothetical protein Aduo_002964 [Ancylostoma duodenale]
METAVMNSRHIHDGLLSVFAVVLMFYSMNSSDGMIGFGSMMEADDGTILHRYHSRNKKARIERAQLREVDVVDEFNSDPLPNRTELKSADEITASCPKVQTLQMPSWQRAPQGNQAHTVL